MKSLLRLLGRLVRSEDGPTAVEYAVMLSLIVIVCLTAIGTIGTRANSAFQKVASSIK
jgi:pilus assembly protein Flp/PilA